MIGTQIHNRYRIESELGQGGMGTVYKGYDITLKRNIAIKILTETRLGTEGSGRLLQEAQAIAQLSHPNIVTVHDVGEYEKTPFIVMEYVAGVNLYEHPPKEIEKIIAVAQQVCAALSHAHEHGIIHRDLKPENVILASDDTAMLMDFGLARSVSSRLTSEGTILGTVFYLAPEQAQGKLIDPRSDLYSLGVMLYELTTGELPFLADDPLAVVSQHIHAPIVPPRAKNDQIPPALEALILALMQKDPAERPASAKEVLERLSAPEIMDVTALPAEELSVLDRIVRGRLVGREQELKQARQMWQQAMGGQGQLLLVSGEPGVGKTRLMREIVTQAEVSGGQTYIGESQAEGNAPYAAFAQIIRRALRSHKNNTLELPNLVIAELISIAPELQFDFPEIDTNPPLEPESEQRRLMESVFRFVDRLGQEKPLLLVFEDIHWADSGTLSLLQLLARRCREHPVMLMGTYREVELDEALPFHQTLLDLNRKNLGTRLKLERLDEDKTRDMLAVIFAEDIQRDFLAGIFQETEGNPFFIEEVCKSLIESGQLYFDGEIWQRPPDMADMEIPQSIKVAVRSRVSKLNETAQEILLTAAVIGREFGFVLLHKVTGKDEDDLIDSLEAALKAQLIEELKEGDGERFSFSHALIPTTLRESLSGMRRTRLHRKVAHVMEEIMPNAYQRLAYHWGEGGDLAKGLDYTIKAAERAKETYANDDAIRLYSEALELVQVDKKRFELLKKRAALYQMKFDRDGQLDDINEMLSIAEKQKDEGRKVDALLALVDYYEGVDLPSARGPAEQAREIAFQMGDIVKKAQTCYKLGRVCVWNYDYINARTHLQDAIRFARESDLTELLGDSLGFITGIYAEQLNQEELQNSIDELEDIYSKSDDLIMRRNLSYRLGGIYCVPLKDFKKGLSLIKESFELSQSSGDINWMGHVKITEGWLRIQLGQLEQAEKIYLDLFQIPEVFSSRIPRYAGFQIGIAHIELGEYEKNYHLMKDFISQALEAGNTNNINHMHRLHSYSCLRLGKYSESLSTLGSVLPDVQKSGDKSGHAAILSTIGVYAALTGDLPFAYEFLEKAHKSCESLTPTQLVAETWSNSALVALIDGRQDAIKTGLEQIEYSFQILQEILSPYPSGWPAHYIWAALHMALSKVDELHAAKALKVIRSALEKYRDQKVNVFLVPEHLFFLASRIFRANNRPEEADEYLRKAYERVKMVAGKIQDDDLRRSYLENVKDNREILQEAKERGIAIE